jgi:hypothetical protein
MIGEKHGSTPSRAVDPFHEEFARHFSLSNWRSFLSLLFGMDLMEPSAVKTAVFARMK